MPVHRVPTATPDLESAVERIESTQEVVSVVTAGDGSVLVFTKAGKARRAAPGDKETRPA